MSGQRQELLRFVLQRRHPDTGVAEGVFGAAYELRDGTVIAASDRSSLEDLLAWFRANLAVPPRFQQKQIKGILPQKGYWHILAQAYRRRAYRQDACTDHHP